MIKQPSEFTAVLQDSGFPVVVVGFFASWCGPCRHMKPAFVDLAGQVNKAQSDQAVAFATVPMERDSDRTLASKFGVTALPTVIFFADGVPLEQITIRGCQPAALKKCVLELQRTYCTRGQRKESPAKGDNEDVCVLPDAKSDSDSAAVAEMKKAMEKQHAETQATLRVAQADLMNVQQKGQADLMNAQMQQGQKLDQVLEGVGRVEKAIGSLDIHLHANSRMVQQLLQGEHDCPRWLVVAPKPPARRAKDWMKPKNWVNKTMASASILSPKLAIS